MQMDKIRDGTFDKHYDLLVRSASWKTLRRMMDLGRNRSAMNGTIAIIVLMVGALLGVGFSQAWGRLKEKPFDNWLELFIVSLVLTGGVVLFQWVLRRSEQRTQHELKIAEWYAQHERELETDRFREVTFQTYLDRMTELLLERGLRSSEPGAEVRDIARARTLTVLQGLDGGYKGILLRFLYEADLIKNKTIIDLRGVDLRGAHLKEVDLGGANLGGVDLSGASLSGAKLNRANLHGAVLIVADLSGADLRMVNLSNANLTEAVLAMAKLNEANLSRADLHGANLEGANLMGINLRQANLRGGILIMSNLIEADLGGAVLSGADLSGAELIEANLTGADLSNAKLKGVTLRGAKYNLQTRWPRGFSPAITGAVLRD